MKNKLLKLTVLCMMTFSIFANVTVPIYASEVIDPVSEITPKEILKSSVTKTVTYAGNKAKITLYYTYRYESTNTSKKYITGVTSASISKVSGWYSVGSATINQSGISYSRNHQVASVPVTYTGGHGEGNNTTCSVTLTISLV